MKGVMHCTCGPNPKLRWICRGCGSLGWYGMAALFIPWFIASLLGFGHFVVMTAVLYVLARFRVFRLFGEEYKP